MYWVTSNKEEEERVPVLFKEQSRILCKLMRSNIPQECGCLGLNSISFLQDGCANHRMRPETWCIQSLMFSCISSKV
uniref:Uncharacterized protein n=1 Tax=Anguilla anguilla TaxID=7936 RepID=A0A0E9PIM6_ANGAN